MKNMKKFIYTSCLLCSLACIYSCVNEEADLFDSSAAQRLNQAVTDYTNLLENSEDGWIMDYYPSDGSLGGYTLTVVFKNGNLPLPPRYPMPVTMGKAGRRAQKSPRSIK